MYLFSGLVVGEAKPSQAGQESAAVGNSSRGRELFQSVWVGPPGDYELGGHDLGGCWTVFKEKYTLSSKGLNEQISVKPPVFKCPAYHVY